MMHTTPIDCRWRLYLDFDGVLNNDGFLRYQRNHVAPGQHRLFDPDNLHALDALCTALGVVEIVVTSSWKVGRTVDELAALLREGGAACARLVVDTTPDIGPTAAERAHEIMRHASRYSGPWLVLDDMDLTHGLPAGIFHRTSGAVGLTLDAVDAIGRRIAGGRHA